MGKFNIEKAKSGITNALPSTNSNVSNTRRIVKREKVIDNNKLHNINRKYYNIETNEPLPLPEIEDRIKRNFQTINRLSVEVMMDLYFLYNNWTSFYKRNDSFKKYVEDNLPISRGYVYNIIKIINMFEDFNNNNSNNKSSKVLNGSTNYIDDFNSMVNDIGMKKLKVVSQVKDEKSRNDVLHQLLEGNKIDDKEILKINKGIPEKVDKDNNTDNTNLKLKDNEIFKDNERIISFYNLDEKIVEKVYNSIKQILKL